LYRQAHEQQQQQQVAPTFTQIHLDGAVESLVADDAQLAKRILTISNNNNNNNTAMTRLAPTSTILLIAALYSCTIIRNRNGATALMFSEKPRRGITDRILQQRRQATKDDTDTWSKATGSSSSSSRRGESRIGVRRRVRDVLRRARERTGVSNDSELLGSDSNLGMEATTRNSSSRQPPRRKLDFGIDADILGADASLSMAGTPLGQDPIIDAPQPPLSQQQSEQQQSLSPVNGVQRNGVAAVAAPSTTMRGGENPSDSSTTVPNSPTTTTRTTTETEQMQPLPFTLPTLSSEQQNILLSGERVQEQSRMAGEGSGFVVMDIPAPEYAVWECLLDFEAYPENIGTVRSMRMFTNTHLKQSYFAETPLPPRAITRRYGKASISRAVFVLSKFRLNIAAVHKYSPHPDGHYMVFTLDRATKNAVLQDAKGIWYTQSNPNGKDGYTRVWLLCELKVSPVLPTFIVDYAARKAMPRATTWLPTVVEQYMQKWKQFMDV